MRIYLILFITIKIVSSVQYNKQCTFSFGTCKWSIGRRWHIISLDNDDKVLIADGESKDDKRVGFTDAIMSSWLHLSPLCSFDIRLTFQFSIQNQDDLIEIYLIQKNRTRLSSVGQWKGITNNNISTDDINPIWHQANVTFKAAEEFRIDIEVRHLPDDKNNSIAWFAIDDILIENCPIAIVNTTSSTQRTTIAPIPWTTTPLRLNENNSTLSNVSQWKLDDLPDEHPSSLSPRLNLLTLILYLLCALIALTLLIILFAIILFTYRKHCFPSPSPMADHQHRSSKNKLNNRIGIQIENIEHDDQVVKTMESTVRPCFQ